MTQPVKGTRPDTLKSIVRADQRSTIGLNTNDLPFMGEDVWNCYEFSWLGDKSCPRAAMLRVVVPCDSEHMVESKSLKLYLNSFAQTRFANEDEIIERLKADVSKICGAPVDIFLMNIDRENLSGELTGNCLDDLAVCIETFQPDATLLRPKKAAGSESVYTHVFRSACPVTGQPDYATIAISYDGGAIQRESLLAYLVSYREYAGFHEHVVERIYRDLMEVGSFSLLSVEGNFLRRGGIDISIHYARRIRARDLLREFRGSSSTDRPYSASDHISLNRGRIVSVQIP